LIDFRPILHVVGYLLAGLAAVMLVPAAVDAGFANPNWKVFLEAAAATGFVAASWSPAPTAAGRSNSASSKPSS
jgi:trk system potassium uptake protein TrkH